MDPSYGAAVVEICEIIILAQVYRLKGAGRSRSAIDSMVSLICKCTIEPRCGAATRAYHSVPPELCRPSLRCSSALQSDQQRIQMRYPDVHPSPSIDRNTGVAGRHFAPTGLSDASVERAFREPRGHFELC